MTMRKENSYSDLENERVKLIILLLSSVVAAGYRGFLNTLLYQRRENKFSAYSQCVKISGAYTTHLKHPHGLHTEQPRRDMFKLSSVKELSRTTPLPCRLLPVTQDVFWRPRMRQVKLSPVSVPSFDFHQIH